VLLGDLQLEDVQRVLRGAPDPKDPSGLRVLGGQSRNILRGGEVVSALVHAEEKVARAQPRWKSSKGLEAEARQESVARGRGETVAGESGGDGGRREAGAVAALLAPAMGMRANEIVSRVLRDLDADGKLLWIFRWLGLPENRWRRHP
jgi:hypothetical protein